VRHHYPGSAACWIHRPHGSSARLVGPQAPGNLTGILAGVAERRGRRRSELANKATAMMTAFRAQWVCGGVVRSRQEWAATAALGPPAGASGRAPADVAAALRRVSGTESAYFPSKTFSSPAGDPWCAGVRGHE